ncbi:class I SAM-dependent methyltransferase [Rubellicoccus peritrichatus]|uniref:Class I SAM-dependent methyltransferase n=1 Tax=Rubellicoccus peritrichatus TaxID=3080537 RepID=A0AAQ3L8H2_9BACT|nr:class I SAM-dependent methyltransferase [Puniceicoccus sp. CR14]WOO41270.1 class I SAM-dependent methyltransferase [Puniceicoccus sp. CR14]
MSIKVNLEVPGWSTEIELMVLARLAQLVPDGGTIVELGTLAGRTAYAMAASNPKVKVHCVDVWENFLKSSIPEPSLMHFSGDIEAFDTENIYECFLKQVEGLDNIVPHRGKTTEVPWDSDEKIDLLYIDADHDEEPVYQDLLKWFPRMKRNGIILGHDFNMGSVKRALARFSHETDKMGEYMQLINIPSCVIWAYVRGTDHAKSWGMDFTSLFPYGCWHYPLTEAGFGKKKSEATES